MRATTSARRLIDWQARLQARLQSHLQSRLQSHLQSHLQARLQARGQSRGQSRLQSRGQSRSASWVLWVAMLFTSTGHAVRPQNVSSGEIAMLPAYCIDTEGFMHGPENSASQSPRAPEWVAKMGRSFWAMHHYCWGLVNFNRLRFGRADTNNKRYFAKQIADEYRYVIEHSTPNFVLLPEIWARIGEASLLAGDIGGAMDAYAKSRSIKPDYPPAYVQWAEFQMNNNRRDEARALIEEGLKNIPGFKPLLDLQRKLGGAPVKSTPKAPTAPNIAASVARPDPAASGASKAP